MRWNSLLRPRHAWGAVLVCIGLLAVWGCEEMPRPSDYAMPGDPAIAVGPYISESDDGKIEIRFVTDRYSIPGIRSVGTRNRIQRYGGRTLSHHLNITDLMGKGAHSTELLLDNIVAARFHLKPRPAPGEPVTLAFLGMDAAQPELLARASERLAPLSPDAVILTGGTLPEPGSQDAWRDSFYTPLTDLVRRAPLWFLPQVYPTLPAGLAPTQHSHPYAWSRPIGSVHVIGFDPAAFRIRADREALLDWLRARFDAPPSGTSWTVVVLDTPLFGSQRIHARLVEALGSLFEVGGVNLVISGGGTYYHRSMPIHADGRGFVQYLVVSGAVHATAGTQGREYTARIANEPHVATLRATPDELHWSVGSLQGGGVLDALTLRRDPEYGHLELSTGEPAVEKLGILTEALSVLTLQREVMTIARQAAQAVPDPAGEQVFDFAITNPSPHEVRGQLFWELPSISSHRIEPKGVQFALASGVEGRARFRIVPIRPDGDPPVLIVNMEEIGSTRQPLLLTPLKEQAIYPADGPIRVDGRLNESVWETATELQGWEVMGLDREPKLHIDARVLYDDNGLYVGVRCAAANPALIATQAKKRDDPVHRDESIEIFLDPGAQGRNYYQFAMNVQGVKLDRSSQAGLAWNPQWEGAVHHAANEYTMEFFIPYASIGVAGPPAPGTVWKFNVTRNDYHDSQTYRSMTPDARRPVRTREPGQIDRAALDAIITEDLGPEFDARADQDAKRKKSGEPEFEVVMWADTHGSNSRSGTYGNIRFLLERAPAEPEASEPEEPQRDPSRPLVTPRGD